MVEQIRAGKAQMDQLTGQIESRVAHEKILHDLGALTVALLDGEVCDWQRFWSSQCGEQLRRLLPQRTQLGRGARFGHIDRHNSRHVRVLLIEAVWRLLRW